MKVVGRDKLKLLTEMHTETKSWLKSWLAEAEDAQWESPQDVKERYRSASILGKNMVVFNVKGNKYRMVCKVSYKIGVISVCWVGTHAQYSKLKLG